MLTVLDEASSDEERQLLLDGCIDLLKAYSGRFDELRTVYDLGCEKLPKLQNQENGFLRSLKINRAQKLSSF
jgi:hypothetical protein